MILNELISSMSKEDVRFFKLYATRAQSSAERKDLQIFDFIRKNKNLPEEIIFKKLYKDSSKSAFYRLKNHLMHEINKSIILQHLDDDDVIYIYHLLSLVRHYLKNNNYITANYFLIQVEKKALAVNSFELLDIIYNEFIKYSQETLNINPEEFITKRKKNREKLNQLRQFDDILAVLIYRLKTTQNYKPLDSSVLKILNKTMSGITSDRKVFKNPILKLKIYEVVSQTLLQKHDYVALENYLEVTYSEFVQEKIFNKSNHNIKLQMITYLVNSLFKNKKYKNSLEYAEKLKYSLGEYDNLLRDKYLFFYYNSLVINYSILNPDKAIEILKELNTNKKLTIQPYYEVFILLNLSILYFGKKEFKAALKSICKLLLSDGVKTLDSVLQIQISVAELIIRVELKDFDFVVQRIYQIKKEYKKMLVHIEDALENSFIEIILVMCKNEGKIDVKLSAAINRFLQTSNEKKQDQTQIIDYADWLKSK